MLPSNTSILEFLEAICSQIRFKGAHKGVICELKDHIIEQTIEYRTQTSG